MKYESLKESEFAKGDFAIVPIREMDMEMIRVFRNDQRHVLRQSFEITKEGQQIYFDKVIMSLFSNSAPSQLLFSFLQKDVLIGYGGLVNISWHDKRAEMSFLVKPEIARIKCDYQKVMFEFIALIKILVFTEMKFNRLYTETYEFREFHIAVLLENGFSEEGRMREHILENGKYYDSILHSILIEDDSNP